MRIVKKISSLLLRIGISIILLIFLFRQVDFKSLVEIVKRADKALILAAFFISFLTHLLCLLRWEMLLKALKIHLPFQRVIISYAGGIFFSLFLPSTIGGDLIRSIDLATHTQRPKEVIATVLLDRLSGFIGLALLALLAVIFGWQYIQDKSILFSVFVLCGILAAILLVLFNRFIFAKINKLLHSPTAGKIRELIKNLHHEIHLFRHREEVIVDNLILSVFIQAIPPLVTYITALSLGVKLNIIYFFIFVPVIGALTLLPISLGGLGVRDAAAIYFFSKVGVAKDLAFAISLLNFVFVIIYGAIGGLIYLLTVHHRRRNL